MLQQISRNRFFRRGLGRPFLVVNEKVWSWLPASLMERGPVKAYGRFLHKLVQLRLERRQNHGTFFFRNRPQLELLQRLLSEKPQGASLHIAVLASSSGAEVYSVLWTVRSARPDLKVTMNALDISEEILRTAQEGVYSFQVTELTHTAIFERTRQEELRAMFEVEGDRAKVKPFLKEGINWRAADALDPGLEKLIGRQDMVIASNFLCHMPPPMAEKCLRNIGRLVKAGGFLFLSGMDLDVRAKVAAELGWSPLRELVEEIHEGDPCMRRDWPWEYWGLEPLDKAREDWEQYYASVFKTNNHV